MVNVSDVTGFPEMMDGRVKTLHPKIHGGILARRASPGGSRRWPTSTASAWSIWWCVNLYPFVETAAKPGITFDELIEQIDIGGPSLVRAAAKNFRDVLIVVSPKDYDAVIAELDRDGGPTPAFRFELARRAFEHTGAYDTAIASTLGEVNVDGDVFRRPSPSPEASSARATYAFDAQQAARSPLRREPASAGAWYALRAAGGSRRAGDPAGQGAVVHQSARSRRRRAHRARIRRAGGGGDQAHQPVRRRDRRNHRRSLRARARSGFAGRLWRHHRPQSPIDEATARAIVSTFIEAVVAPASRTRAHRSSPAKANLRVVVADFRKVADTREYRSILGAMLVQERDRVIEAQLPWPADGIKVVTKRQPTADEWQAMRFAWRVMAHVKSNTVIFTDAVRTLAIGAGQMSRVDAVKVAVNKAGGWKGGSAPTLEGIGRGIGCVLPVPRRPRCRCRRWRDCGRAAGRIGEGCGSDRRRG